MIDFAANMETVARALLGEPNKLMSKSNGLRFGKQGSMEIILDKGVFHDHESDAKGGVLELIKRERKCDNAGAFDYMKSIGIQTDDRPKTNGHAPAQQSNSSANPAGEIKIVATYPYFDAAGNLLYEVVRLEPKSFRQRRPAPERPGAWIWALAGGDYVKHDKGTDFYAAKDSKGNLRGPEKGWNTKISVEPLTHGLFNFPEIAAEMALDESERQTIFLPEGEKDVLTLGAWDILATTNSGGAKHWQPHLAQIFKGADVVIPIDNDKAGRERGAMIAKSLKGIAKRVRVLDWADHWQGGPDKSDVTDWRDAAGGTKDKLFEIVDKLPVWAEGPFNSKFGAVAWKDIKIESQAYDWLIRDILPAKERTMIFGEPGCGKSFVAADMALAIARGVPYGKHQTKKAGVVYCAFEGGKGFAIRTEGYRQHHELSLADDVPFVMFTRGVDILTEEDAMKEMKAELKHWAETFTTPLGLVVFDTVSASSGSMDDSDPKEVAKYLMKGRDLIEGLDCAMLYVHHKAKNNGTSPRGSGKWTGDLEATIEIFPEPHGQRDENDREIRIVHLRKIREGQSNREIKRFVLRQIEVGTDLEGQPIKTCIVLPPGDTANKTGKAFAATPQEEKVLRAFINALKKHGVPAPEGVQVPSAKTLVINYRQWREEYEAFDLNPEEDTSKRNSRVKAAMQRAAHTFIDKFEMKIIARHKYSDKDQLFWLTGQPVRGFPETYLPAKPVYADTMPAAEPLLDSEF